MFVALGNPRHPCSTCDQDSPTPPLPTTLNPSIPTSSRLSRLFVYGTCLQTRNNEASGCSGSNQTVISGSTSGSGASFPTSNTGATCNQVFSGAAPSGSTVSLQSAGSGVFDSSGICAYSSQGFFYIQNNCAASTGESLVTLSVDITSYSGSCNNYTGLALWAKVIISVGVVVAFICIASLFWRRRRRRVVG